MKWLTREALNIWIGLPVLCISGSFCVTVILGTIAKKVGLL
jgi:hypothetical protein